MSIQVENLTKIYGNQKAIDEISFEIEKGEIVGFLGPNGAGKSTTMKILSCFTWPDSGFARVNGFDILNEAGSVKKSIGYLPENNPLYDEMYIREYLTFIARTYPGLENRDKRVNEMIELIGLEPEIRKKIGELSKGFRQRVGLAQALIHDPEVLILDEPTSGLDPNQVVEIRKLIREAGKTKTVILSSHIMQEIQALCDRVIIINKGIIVSDNPIDSLLSSSDTVKVELILKKPVRREDLLKIDGVSRVEIDKENTWLIYSTELDLAEKIFNYAVETANIILELKTEKQNLEEIFQHLTEDQKQ